MLEYYLEKLTKQTDIMADSTTADDRQHGRHHGRQTMDSRRWTARDQKGFMLRRKNDIC